MLNEPEQDLWNSSARSQRLRLTLRSVQITTVVQPPKPGCWNCGGVVEPL